MPTGCFPFAISTSQRLARRYFAWQRRCFVSQTVAGAALPGFIHDEPPHIHDASSLPITNIVQNVFLEGATETNVVYSCQTNPAAPSVTGFFRVGTRQDTDGDSIPDAYETMVLGTDPLDPILYNSSVTGGSTNEIGAYSFDAPPAITNGTTFTSLLYDILVE